MEKLHETPFVVNNVVPVEFSMKKLVVYLLMVFLLLFHISCRSENTHQISTITIEVIDREGDAAKGYDVSWQLVADPAPDEDLVVLIGRNHQSDDWFDYDRNEWVRALKNRYDPPYFVVIGKSNRYSSTYKTHTLHGDYSIRDTFPIYINPLPSMSVVGKGVSIDTQTLTSALPVETRGGHIIPKEHQFVRYQVGKPCGISKHGNLIYE